MMNTANQGITATLLDLPIFEAEWVLWFLIALSVASVAVVVERFLFFRRRRVRLAPLQDQLNAALARGDLSAASQALDGRDTLEAHVVSAGLLAHAKGAEAAEDLMSGAARQQEARYSRRLVVLATVGSNAPFIGLFGTVLGIIRAFADLSENMNDASQAVMAGISEALVATAVGLLVAIPAVVAYNYFRNELKKVSTNAHVLARTVVAHLKATDNTRGE